MRLQLKIAILKTERTQRELSTALSIPETRFSEIVRGRANPTDAERERICELLGDDVFEDEENGELVEQRSRRQ